MTDQSENRPPRPAAHVYGRRSGKKLRSRQSHLMADLLPQLRADAFLEKLKARGPAQSMPEIWLEIGFGGGEHLVAQAMANPNIEFIGCEPFINGVAKLVASVQANELTNIHIHASDAMELLDQLPDASVARLYVLFPDPWPKRSQKKRRFINEASIARFARVLKANAELRFATDIDDYAGWTLARLLVAPQFVWTQSASSEWNAPWSDHHTTRYESKAALAGRRSVYLTFRRNES